jgi:hypothetical protein
LGKVLTQPLPVSLLLASRTFGTSQSLRGFRWRAVVPEGAHGRLEGLPAGDAPHKFAGRGGNPSGVALGPPVTVDEGRPAGFDRPVMVEDGAAYTTSAAPALVVGVQAALLPIGIAVEQVRKLHRRHAG